LACAIIVFLPFDCSERVSVPGADLVGRRDPDRDALLRLPPVRRLVPALLATALLAAACGSDSDDSASSTEATDPSAPVAETTATTTPGTAPATAPDTTRETTPETTEPPAPAVTPADLAAPGPYAVGVTTRTLPEGGLVEIWYPADDSTRGGTDTYAVRDFLPDGIAALIREGIDDTFTYAATRDGAAAPDGPFPIVLSSHGIFGHRMVSTRLNSNLATWGIVVAAPDHPSRDLANLLGGSQDGQPPAADQLRSARTYLATLEDDPLLGGTLDTDRIALGGESAGGGTVAEVALDDGILGYVSYASGLPDDVPDVPSLFVTGALDSVVPAETTRAAFEMAPAPSWSWVIAAAGHNVTTDVCLIGGGAVTLPELADRAGLGDFVDDRLRVLASDGCREPNRPVTEIIPAVDQASVGFYRWVFGLDAEPVGLDESAITDDVEIASK
jgi:dienelactone hydrolase